MGRPLGQQAADGLVTEAALSMKPDDACQLIGCHY
jgi:hypothetical protein